MIKKILKKILPNFRDSIYIEDFYNIDLTNIKPHNVGVFAFEKDNIILKYETSSWSDAHTFAGELKNNYIFIILRNYEKEEELINSIVKQKTYNTIMETDFKLNKQEFLNLDRTIADIEFMSVFGGGWRGGKQEMMLRVLYKNEKRIITTVHEGTWQDELKTLILKTRTKYRDLKLSRIINENL